MVASEFAESCCRRISLRLLSRGGFMTDGDLSALTAAQRGPSICLTCTQAQTTAASLFEQGGFQRASGTVWLTLTGFIPQSYDWDVSWDTATACFHFHI
ncbi:hypothetical protein ILYODFUR_029789 [Ilyodon furcidens]|uniref:Uncharacterized protein n=1 Tax=Ilyodon furcidens TaxID=33524 RepID=A0ABV0UWN8_9TELE